MMASIADDGRPAEGVAAPSSADAHLRLQEALRLPFARSKEKLRKGKVSQATDWAPAAFRQETQWQIAPDRGLPATV
jgi:hypothetical protein